MPRDNNGLVDTIEWESNRNIFEPIPDRLNWKVEQVLKAEQAMIWWSSPKELYTRLVPIKCLVHVKNPLLVATLSMNDFEEPPKYQGKMESLLRADYVSWKADTKDSRFPEENPKNWEKKFPRSTQNLLAST